MNPIKIGMIGFGRMGGFYLEQMQKSGRWEVAYICDVSAESREEARRLAPQAQVIADEQIIFDDPEVAVVGLFALADSRLSQIGKAVAAGKHIIAEKPIADSVERSTSICAIRGITIRSRSSSPRARSANWRSSAYAT